MNTTYNSKDDCPPPRANGNHGDPRAPGATISVEWGYGRYSLLLSPQQWAVVRSGQTLDIDGPGYMYEGAHFQDHWRFEGGLHGKLLVTYGDDGGVGYEGTLGSAEIEVHPLPAEVLESGAIEWAMQTYPGLTREKAEAMVKAVGF